LLAHVIDASGRDAANRAGDADGERVAHQYEPPVTLPLLWLAGTTFAPPVVPPTPG
jgi:hypothetical protein